MHWFYYVGRVLTRISLSIFTNWEVRGRENIPPEGSLPIAANHLHLADPPLLGVSIKRKIMFIAKEELFRSRFSGYFIRNFGAVPVRREGTGRTTLRMAEQLLAQGWALAMFPEGKRSKNAQLQSAFHGSALIALRSGAPILPVGITGTEKIKGRGWLFHRPKITVNIGSPFSPPKIDGRLTKEEIARFTDCIMEHIAELLPDDYRGNYNDKGIKEVREF